MRQAEAAATGVLTSEGAEAARGPVARPSSRWPRWPWDLPLIDAAWAAFALVNLVAIFLLPRWETVPFHFIWVSLTIVYGFRVWRISPTLWTLALVIGSTGLLIARAVSLGAQPLDELTEVPLMAAMFLAMMAHARRRLSAMNEVERISAENLEVLERTHRFVQDASHELRTPITVALGHAELVHRSLEDLVAREDARVVVEELMRLRRLADRLLYLATSDGTSTTLHLEDVEVEPILVDAIRRWTPTPRAWRLGRLDDVIVRADTDRLALALDALIENAVKHTTSEDAIELSVARREGAAVVSVRDTGPGIPPEDLDRIFERFGRAARPGGVIPGGVIPVGVIPVGTGLGLSIVRAVAEAHGGTVRVQSSPGVGSAFDLVLPLGDDASGTAARAAGPTAGSAPTATAGAADGPVVA